MNREAISEGKKAKRLSKLESKKEGSK